MDTNAATSPSSAERPTAETNGPVNGTGPNGEAAPAIDPREARREARLLSLEKVRQAAEEMSLQLNNGFAGRLPEHEQWQYDRVKDVPTAFTRVTKTFMQIIAMEERVEEDAETRRARIQAEAAERAAR